jgi:tRNA A37 threonylcarbamoyladenosine dehydratase
LPKDAVVSENSKYACKNPTRSHFEKTEKMQGSVLVVGAGGIGCELLKTLVLSGFLDIHVVSCIN